MSILTLAQIRTDLLFVGIILGLGALVAFIAPFFPAVRRNNAILAPCIVIITLVLSLAAVFGLLVVIHAASA